MKTVYSFLFIILSSYSVYAIDNDSSAYVGVTAQMRKIEFKDGYGDNIFPKRIPQGEIYTGFKLNPYVGFELAYLRSVESHRAATTSATSSYFGITPFREQAKTSSRIDGGGMNVVGFLPIAQNLQLLGSLGVARLRIKLAYVPVGDDFAPYSASEVSGFTRNYVAWRYIPQVKAGVQYMISEAVGLKALVGWDGTSRFNLLRNKEASAARVSLKNSYNVGLGLAYYFN